MRLLMVELSRFRSRRAIVLIVLAAALLVGLVAGTTVWDTRPVSATELARAEAQAEKEAAQPWVQDELEACREDAQMYLGGNTEVTCEEAVLPQPAWFLDRQQLDLEAQKDNNGLAVLVITAGLMIIVGTTFAGADWGSGSMSNQLLFRPRRGQVWLAKAAAVFLATLVVSAVVVAGFWAALLLAADARDITTAASVREQIGWSAGRGVLLAALGATGGYALTMLFRHTVGVLALLFGYTVGGEMLIAALPFEGSGRWSLGNNVFAWIQHGYEYYDYSLPCTEQQCDQLAVVTFSQGVTYLGVLLLVVAVASVLSFRRRDIP
ncbi:MAG: hypothetical protein ACOYX5_18980 [Actinomycetota bacterium]